MNENKKMTPQKACFIDFKKRGLAAAVAVLTVGLTAPAFAAVELYDGAGDSGVTLSGSIPVYVSSISGEDDNKDGVRVTSSFNPANFTLGMHAPTYNGIKVSGTIQVNTHLQGGNLTQNDNSAFESRVAEIAIGGDFGAVNIGKGFGIINSNAIADDGSAKGIGRLFGGADQGAATAGRIGVGYIYANFNPRVIYTSPDMGGLSFKVGIFQPNAPDSSTDRFELISGTTVERTTDTFDADAEMPRFEGQITYATSLGGSTTFKTWVGAMQQEVEVASENFEYDMTAVDVGFHLGIAGIGLSAAYTDTTGIGQSGIIGGDLNSADADTTQWYTELDYTFGKTMIGVSYGEGDQDAETTVVGSAAEGKNEMSMLFARYQLTPQLTLLGEAQQMRSDFTAEYDLVAIGAQFDF